MNLFDLNGKRAIVTGGNRGLGRGMAEGLCEAGAKVVVMASSDSVTDSARELSSKGYFSKIFREREGVTPKEFRKNG
jgi:2-deoxy-D-gluconate 3-dehydrogenase